MQFAKTREVKSPQRAHDTDVGIDFFVPEDFKTVKLNKGDSVLIPSGIKVNVPKGYALIAFNKSGVALKKGLMVGACVVDPGYQGEIFINLLKVTGDTVEINAGDKIVQFVLLPVVQDNLCLVQESELFSSNTDRGSGGFGSTGS